MAVDELPSTSVVIPTYNRAGGLAGLLKPVLEDSFPLEVVVVADGCRDGTMEVLEDLAKSDSRLKPVWIENSGEMGARAAGVARAEGEVILMLDDDVRPGPDLARNHAKRHAGAEGLVVLGYMPVDTSRARAAGDFATFLYAQEYERACEQYEASPGHILSHLWAGNISLRREDALRVGLHNPGYKSPYHQDREFGIRCLKAGLEGVFDRGLWAEHLHSRGLQAFRRDARAEGAGRRELHALHEDILGPLPADEFAQGVPAPLRALMRACRRPAVYRAVTSSSAAIVELAGKLRIEWLEVNLAKLLRRVEQEQGALEAAGGS